MSVQTAPLPDHAPFRATDEIRDLVAAFEATTLPYARWTHAAHLTVALWYIAWYGPEQATDRMRAGLQRYNTAHAREPMRVGYHETMTRFWLWVVGRYLRSTPIRGSLAELTNGLIAACVDRELPFSYYSRERLLSPEARRAWVEPDVRPLDP